MQQPRIALRAIRSTLATLRGDKIDAAQIREGRA